MRYYAQSHKLLNHEDESFEGPQNDCSGVQNVPPEYAQCNPLLGAPGDQVVYYVEDTNVNLVILCRHNLCIN